MVKRLFKKSIACLLAAIMIAASLPLTALADATTDAVIHQTITSKNKSVGIITKDANGGGRVNGNAYNIVNDGTDDRFTAAFWKYDSSEVKNLTGTTINSANFTFTIKAGGMSNCQGFSIYYATKDSGIATLSAGINGGSWTGCNSIYTSSNHIANITEYLGLTYINSVSADQLKAASAGTEFTVDVKAAYNYAIENDKSMVTLVLMQTAAASGSSGDNWSDTHIFNYTPDIVCNYDENVEVIPGLEGINREIAAYETKMSQVGKNGLVYKNMKPAYDAYQKAIKYRDAFEFGGQTAPTADEVTAVAEELCTKTGEMVPWTDDVTGKMASKQPVFVNNNGRSPVENDSKYTYYSNILYTEDCVGKNNGKNDGDRPGAAIRFDKAADVWVEIYYPNTVLLYDGTTPARMPIMFMAKVETSEAYNDGRTIWQVYASSPSPGDTYKTTKAGFEREFKNMQVTSYKDDLNASWRGKDGTNNLDFNNCRNNGTKNVSGDPSLNTSFCSDWLGYSLGGWWNAYATSFEVDGKLFEELHPGKGLVEVGNNWTYYGGMGNPAALTMASDPTALCGQASSTDKDGSPAKNIFVINYKGLVDLIKTAENLTTLKDVTKYKEGGLAQLMTLYDEATAYAQKSKISEINFANALEKGREITTIMGKFETILDTATADTGAAVYNELKTAIKESKKTYQAGNKDNVNYTAEVWGPFETAYNNATGYFHALYPNGTLNMADAEQYIQPLRDAKANLKNGMIKTVVNTDTLEIVIANAEMITHNPGYFTAQSVNAETLSALLTQVKTEIWGSEANYGYDTKKLELSTQNQEKVDSYTQQLSTIIAGAVFDFDYVTSTGLSMNSAIEKASKLNPNDWGNYNVVESAVAECNTFKTTANDFNGQIADIISNTISSYEALVSKVDVSIKGLSKPFNKISNGAVANSGEPYTTSFNSSQNARKDYFKFSWNYTTGTILFKTKREAFTYKIPVSKWGIYSNQTHKDFEAMADCISINIPNTSTLPTGEITTKSAAGYGWPTGNGLSASQLKDYAPSNELNGKFVISVQDEVKVTQTTGKAVGIDKNGNYINSMDYNFIDEITTLDGVEKISRGGIYAKNGWSYFNTKTVLTTKYDAANISETTLPSKWSEFVDCRDNYVGMVYFWKLSDTGIKTHAGYGFDKGRSNFTAGVVNVVPLFELIDQIKAPEYQATKSRYTKATWDSLEEALSEANKDFDYSKMTYDQIIAVVDGRYTNLWNAKKNLQPAASNENLKQALAQTKKAFENDENKVKPEGWAVFKKAYLEAQSKIRGDYNDANITTVAKTDQASVDKYATALLDAFNKLIYQIDFTPVDNAVRALVDDIADDGDYVYTAASVNAVNEAIKKLTYFTWSITERRKHYTDESDVVSGVKTEAEVTIPGLKSLLVRADFDDQAILAAKEDAKAKLSDPDAYNQTQVEAAINALQTTQQVFLQNSNINCRMFANQQECDAAIKKALEGIQLNQYSVTIVPNGDTSKAYIYNGQTYDYGTEITVSLADNSEVDWYYEMTSPSGVKVANKLYSTTDALTFIIRGNTTLTTKSASKSDQCKISYVNGLNSAIVATDYYASGSTVTLDSNIAPVLPYYTFESFVVNGQTKKSGDTITVSSDTTITLVYTFSGSTTYKVYTIGLGAMNPGAVGIPASFIVDSLKYNDEVSFKVGDSSNGYNDGYGGENLNYQVSKYNGNQFATETVTVPDAYGQLIDDNTLCSNAETYAWLKVEVDDWDNFEKSPIWTAATSYQSDNYNIDIFKVSGTNIEDYKNAILNKDVFTQAGVETSVIKYGTDFTFRVHENCAIIPISKVMYDQAIVDGIIQTEKLSKDGVSVTTKPELVIAPGEKLSIISSYAIPTGCTMVEKGILVKVNKNGTDVGDGYDLKLANAGKNGVNRLKSNYQTEGNQFVISINTKTLDHANIQDVGLIWKAYVTYRNADGELVTQYTLPTTPTNSDTY
ncbi:hypothetical protein [uncultured Eubacterium sp.]|uniref:hypothetical protein n=1 Tax=uncultured Eubacterium sp. TaxID=165185 RepID=UPI00258841C7|nr:hypothetical protein [uncultured Eubacterium sp.]